MADTLQRAFTYEQMIELFDRSHREFEESKKEMRESYLRTEEQFRKTDEQFKRTDEQLKKTDERFLKTDEEFKLNSRKIDRQIQELGKQIGGLGNKFGLYNEGLFMPSLIRIIENDFDCIFYANNSKIRNNGSSFEIDFWGYSETACYIFEVKTNLKSEAISQLENTILLFRERFPEYNSKKLYGVIAAVQFNSDLKKEVNKAGFYFISITDDVAELKNPASFHPKEW